MSDKPTPDSNEDLKAENEFLKMKLMLEKGAQFGGGGENELPPELENQFLQNIIAFEKQYEERKQVKVFDKIGRPDYFKPAAEIPDENIEQAWNELSYYLNEHTIDLGVCSPNVSKRELYRFTVEELFCMEIDDIDLPGWNTNFIYDEFYPDPVYDNSRCVENDLLRDIFGKGDMLHDFHYDPDGFSFNDNWYENRDEFIAIISRFKSMFDEIELEGSNITSCKVEGTECEVKAHYEAKARTGNEQQAYKGDITVGLIKKEDYWYFKSVRMEGFDPS